jgi:hypothetical protein
MDLFENIHKEPTDSHDTCNLVAQLAEGIVVASMSLNHGPWIPHTYGGWSIAVP